VRGTENGSVCIGWSMNEVWSGKPWNLYRAVRVTKIDLSKEWCLAVDRGKRPLVICSFAGCIARLYLCIGSWDGLGAVAQD